MEGITLVKDAAHCCGCGACMTVCPKAAITMEADAYGCKYPKIDSAACIQCGKCVRVCGYTKKRGDSLPLTAYAAVGRCDELVKNSASGGVFASLAEGFIRDGGLVAGAVLDCESSRVEVYHLLSDKMEDLHRMQGSKYVQSEAWRCYPQVIQALKAGKKVLFSGTPCQVAAIKELTGDPENLITADLVCHGVPPLQMLNDYLKILAKRLGGEIVGFRFRDKSRRKQYCSRIDVKKGNKQKRVYLKSTFLSFYKYFLDGSVCRENCYSCPYASTKRVSDITLGDYWGIEEVHAEDMEQGRMPRREDWSCLLVHSEKGESFLSGYRNGLVLYPTKTQWVAKKNQQLNAPAKKSRNREKLLKGYAQKGYAAVEAACIRENGGALRFYWRMAKALRDNSK